MSYAIIGPGGATNNSVKNRAAKLSTGIGANYFNHEWKRRNQKRNYSVVNAKGKMVGFALIEVKKPTMKIHLIATKPGRGIGKVLMERIIRDAKRSRYQVVFFDAVPSAVGFYQKLGFATIGKKNSLTLMAKNIRPVKRVPKPKAAATTANPNLNRFLKASSAVSNSLRKPANNRSANLSRFLKAASAVQSSFKK